MANNPTPTSAPDQPASGSNQVAREVLFAQDFEDSKIGDWNESFDSELNIVKKMATNSSVSRGPLPLANTLASGWAPTETWKDYIFEARVRAYQKLLVFCF